MKPEPLIQSLLRFLDESPCNFLAVSAGERLLQAAGYRRRELTESFADVEPGEKFYVTKNDSALFAVRVGQEAPSQTGFKIVAAHSDSPGFRIKPHAQIVGEGGVVRLNTEVYGGPILYTWFDRPLSVAGRVVLSGDDALHPVSRLVDLRRPLLTIAHLAIHFNRAVNEGNALSKQHDMLPIAGMVTDALEHDDLLLNEVARALDVPRADILDFDLTLHDVQPATLFGMHDELISSGRLDDLSMVHAALIALAHSRDERATCVAAIFDNEETGSGTKQGAGSPVLANLLRRVTEALGGATFEDFARAVERSFMISADNAHAYHPNYAGKYDPTNHPQLGGGPVVKVNANCKYMSDGHSAAVFRELCRKAGVPCQTFVNHSDVAGGSTLGNILTGQLPLEGVDVGNPLLAMHSVRETASTADHIAMTDVMTTFFNPL